MTSASMIFSYLPPSQVPFYEARQKKPGTSGKSQWSVAEAMSTLKGEKTDVVLLVGPQLKPTYVHSSLLIKESRFFAAIAQERWTSPNSNYLEPFPHVSVDSMDLLLIALYDRQLPTNASLEQTLELHMLSLTFRAPSLNSVTRKWIKLNLNATNCVTLYHHGLRFGDSKSFQVPRATRFILQNPDSVLNQDSQLCALNPDLLSRILGSETVQTSEFLLFQALLRWTSCVEQSNPTEYKSRVAKFHQLSSLIRYSLMTPEQFLHILRYNIFTQSDADLILTHIHTSGLSFLPDYLKSFPRGSNYPVTVILPH